MVPDPGSAPSAPDETRSRGWSGRPSGWTTEGGAPETLRRLYEQYCRVERDELLALVPREGLRRLWRVARESESESERPVCLPSTERLRAAAARILPLPPYDVWLRSYLKDRAPYLERLGVPAAPSRTEPVTVATRPLADDLWVHLDVVHGDAGWKGFLSFHGSRVRSGLRTTEVFRSGEPDEFRARFREFTRPTLEAFWRSVTG